MDGVDVPGLHSKRTLYTGNVISVIIISHVYACTIKLDEMLCTA